MSQGDDIRTFMEHATRQQASLVTRAVSLRVLRGVVLSTPVDTGRARANWQTDVGPGRSGEVDAEDRSGGSTIAAGSATIATQRDFQQVSLTNNVPYINALEDGSSRQAPAGMVDVTLAGMGLAPGRDA